MTSCPQCGAADGQCREKFEEMLALEFREPEVFSAVHHLTVICYSLQHPGEFTPEAIEWTKASLHAVLMEGVTHEELRERNKRLVVTVKRKDGNETAPLRKSWTMTATDVRTDNADHYVHDIKAWASSVLKDLGA